MNLATFDIETDGFVDKLTMMSVAWTYNHTTEEYTEYTEHEVPKMVADLNKCDAIIAHNGIGFDVPALAKLCPTKLTPIVYDTMVTARLYRPDLVGGHSLESWGKRLGILKGEVDDSADDIAETYGVYTPELSEYCKQDVAVTVALFDFLEDKGYTADLLLTPMIKMRL